MRPTCLVQAQFVCQTDVPDIPRCPQHTGMAPTHWDIPDILGCHHHSKPHAQSTELGFVLCAFLVPMLHVQHRYQSGVTAACYESPPVSDSMGTLHTKYHRGANFYC